MRGPKGGRPVRATSGAKRGWGVGDKRVGGAHEKETDARDGRPYNRSVDWNNQKGDALSGASCGFSTLHPYGG